MHVCLLGGNGFIGSHVLDDLRELGHSVVVYDRQEERYRPKQENVAYINGELNDYEKLLACLSGVDSVIHLASVTTPETSNENPVDDVQSNLVAALGLLEACVKQQIGRLVFVSSGGTVYGIPKQHPVPESHATDPISSYGIIKLAIEKYVGLYGQLHNLQYRILRPSNPYGERQNPLGNQGIIGVFLWRILQGLPVVVFGDGNVVRDYVFIGDLSRGICSVLEHDGPSRIFNIGSSKGLSINELLVQIEKALGLSIEILRSPGRSFDVPEVVLDTRLIREETDWDPQVSMAEGLRRTMDWLTELEENSA